MTGLAQLFLQPLDGLQRFGLDRVLHLHLQHQVAAAAQIEAQLDVLLQVRLQLADRFGQADDAVDADQDRSTR